MLVEKCPKCGSNNIKADEDENDFLSYKGEGEAARTQIDKKKKYICWEENCGYRWEEDIRNQVTKLCEDCVNKREDKYYCVLAGKLLWEGEMTNHSNFYCSKCQKEFEVGEKMFILKPQNTY